jgi:CheY-like chemotaxis protein
VTPQRTILVVDDAPVFRELGSLFLARSGRVITASYGNEALVAMQRERPDVVVTDLHMPGMDGDALCREIKSDLHLRHIPVIVATSGESADERARAVLAGADDVIAKPIRRLSLIQAVNRFLRGYPAWRCRRRYGSNSCWRRLSDMPGTSPGAGSSSRPTPRRRRRQRWVSTSSSRVWRSFWLPPPG